MTPRDMHTEQGIKTSSERGKRKQMCSDRAALLKTFKDAAKPLCRCKRTQSRSNRSAKARVQKFCNHELHNASSQLCHHNPIRHVTKWHTHNTECKTTDQKCATERMHPSSSRQKYTKTSCEHRCSEIHLCTIGSCTVKLLPIDSTCLFMLALTILHGLYSEPEIDSESSATAHWKLECDQKTKDYPIS